MATWGGWAPGIQEELPAGQLDTAQSTGAGQNDQDKSFKPILLLNCWRLQVVTGWRQTCYVAQDDLGLPTSTA